MPFKFHSNVSTYSNSSSVNYSKQIQLSRIVLIIALNCFIILVINIKQIGHIVSQHFIIWSLKWMCHNETSKNSWKKSVLCLMLKCVLREENEQKNRLCLSGVRSNEPEWISFTLVLCQPLGHVASALLGMSQHTEANSANWASFKIDVPLIYFKNKTSSL